MIQRVIQLVVMPGLTMIMTELTAQWIQETITSGAAIDERLS